MSRSVSFAPALPGAADPAVARSERPQPQSASQEGLLPPERRPIPAPGSGDIGGVPLPPARRLPQLDARLRAAADWVAPCGVCADIGCDHGRFGAVLLAEGRCQLLLAADLSNKALAKARARLSWLGYEEASRFAVADGLDALDILPGQRADCICLLGMGGDTLAGILRRGQARLARATLILSPQTEPERVRAAVVDVGYHLVREQIVREGDRFYLLLLAHPAQGHAQPYDERALWLGPCLLRDKPVEWKPWLLRRQRLLSQSVAAMERTQSPRDATRLEAYRRELAYTQEALLAMDMAQGGVGD